MLEKNLWAKIIFITFLCTMFTINLNVSAQDTNIDNSKIIKEFENEGYPAVENEMDTSEINLPAGSAIQIPEEIKGDSNPEQYINNGIDDDNDGVIDEGITKGNFQIAIYNTDDLPDDIWRVYVDNKYIGEYLKGKNRCWDLTLTPGVHNIRVEAVYAEDRTGNYSIWFGGATKIKGPPMDSFSASEETFFNWDVTIP